MPPRPPPDGIHRPAESEEALSFGDFLRRERLKARRTLGEESKTTGVPFGCLEALEENEFDKLPPPIYVSGYLATFARAHDLSTEDLRGRFERAYESFRRMKDEEPGTIFGIFSPPGEKFQWRDWSVPMGLAAVVVLFSLLSPLLPREEPGLAVVEEAPPSTPPPADRPAERESLPPPAFNEAGVRVVLSAEAVTRVTASLDGGKTEEWTMQAGETRYLAASKDVVVSLGNAGVVRLNYNGRELGFIGGKGEMKRGVRFVAGRDQ